MPVAMVERRVKVRFAGWDDPNFLAAVNATLREAAVESPGIHGRATAGCAHRILRATRFPAAVISSWRALDDALHHVAHWTVRRVGALGVPHA
ncbi:MAG TPA: hypothetical protein VNF73_02410 [Candidatus Saccharimonadales bacterium]|nr:hypothetical protein [Candidatus Saccharimonadales bacterium]